MSRWRYPFRSKAEAQRYVASATKESGKKAFVKDVSYKVTIYKIFTSEEEYRKYLADKQAKFEK